MRHHAPEEAQALFESGRLAVDLAQREVRVGGEILKLTPTEYALLRLFVQHPGRIITHGQILRVYVTGLRKKIETRPEQPELIVTEPGVGYRLKILQPG